MASEKIAEVVIRPLGEGGDKLGMTRAEILEHLNHLDGAFQAAVDGSVQFLFAWLVAMFFVAHRLSRVQFFVANGFYLVICVLQYVTMLSIFQSQDVWSRYGGFYTQSHEVGTEPTLLDRFLEGLIGGYSISLVFWALIAASIWWAVSCRRNQPKEIGSPI